MSGNEPSFPPSELIYWMDLMFGESTSNLKAQYTGNLHPTITATDTLSREADFLIAAEKESGNG